MEVEVGPIWNQRHAEEVAAEYIQNHPDFEWTGHWNTTRPGQMSVIFVQPRINRANEAIEDDTHDVEVGPIWNQAHAYEVACTYIQDHPDLEWTGQWNTTQPGVMSVIQVRRKPLRPRPETVHSLPQENNAHFIEVGPIWSQAHASEVANRYILEHPEMEWTGHWNTTRPGIMSVIQVKRRQNEENQRKSVKKLVTKYHWEFCSLSVVNKVRDQMLFMNEG